MKSPMAAAAGLVLAGLVSVPLRAEAPAASPSPLPRPGDVVPAFDAESLDGVKTHVDYPKGRPTVLVFFTSGCPVCRGMLPEWRRMYEQRGSALNVVGVILDREPPGFFAAAPVPFTVVRSPGRPFTDALKISRVPVTLRVLPGGKVEDVAVGHVDPIRLGQLFRP